LGRNASREVPHHAYCLDCVLDRKRELVG
jgi:hypothetical protein